MRFWKHVPNSLRNKNLEKHIPYLLEKMVFLAFKTLRVQGKNTFLSTLNVIILQTVKNECVRFGGHVDIEVNLALNRGCFEAVLMKYTHRTLGVKYAQEYLDLEIRRPK
jgi:hypothetical protein